MPRRSKLTTTKSSSKSTDESSSPQCDICGRSLEGYDWEFEDGQDGYICTANHPELGGDVAFFKFKLSDDMWHLVRR